MRKIIYSDFENEDVIVRNHKCSKCSYQNIEMKTFRLQVHVDKNKKNYLEIFKGIKQEYESWIMLFN